MDKKGLRAMYLTFIIGSPFTSLLAWYNLPLAVMLARHLNPYDSWVQIIEILEAWERINQATSLLGNVLSPYVL